MNATSHPVSLNNFITRLLPNFERSRVSEDVQMLREDVDAILLPAFKQAATVIADRKLTSKLVIDFDEVFRMTVATYRRVGYFNGMIAFFTALSDKLDMVARLIPDEFAKDITKESLTYRKTAFLQYLAVTRFVNEYSSRVLLRLVAAEQKAQLGKVNEIDDQLTKAELQWLRDNQESYFQAVQFMSIPLKELSSAFDRIPQITVVPERISEVAQTVGATTLDPMNMRFISGTWNPIFHLRSLWLERQIEAYQRDKETKRALELRIMALRKAYEGTQDARIEDQIKYIEGRLVRINHSIHEMEQHAAQ